MNNYFSNRNKHQFNFFQTIFYHKVVLHQVETFLTIVFLKILPCYCVAILNLCFTCRSRHHNKSVSWLRKTEYISTEYNRFQQSATQAESK